jgi:hypothetical protein
MKDRNDSVGIRDRLSSSTIKLCKVARIGQRCFDRLCGYVAFDAVRIKDIQTNELVRRSPKFRGTNDPSGPVGFMFLRRMGPDVQF